MSAKTETAGRQRYQRIQNLLPRIGFKSMRAFCTKIGVNYETVRQMNHGRSSNIPPTMLSYLSKLEPPVSIDYLIDGILPIFMPSKNMVSTGTIQPVNEDETEQVMSIPFFDVQAAAGNPTFTIDSPSSVPAENIKAKALNGAQVAISVFGDSMADAFPGGSIIALRKIEDLSIIPFGEAYVIETADHRLLKYIRRGSKPSTVLLESHNDRYEPFEIERSKIKKLWKVVGLIRRISS